MSGSQPLYSVFKDAVGVAVGASALVWYWGYRAVQAASEWKYGVIIPFSNFHYWVSGVPPFIAISMGMGFGYFLGTWMANGANMPMKRLSIGYLIGYLLVAYLIVADLGLWNLLASFAALIVFGVILSFLVVAAAQRIEDVMEFEKLIEDYGAKLSNLDAKGLDLASPSAKSDMTLSNFATVAVRPTSTVRAHLRRRKLGSAAFILVVLLQFAHFLAVTSKAATELGKAFSLLGPSAVITVVTNKEIPEIKPIESTSKTFTYRMTIVSQTDAMLFATDEFDSVLVQIPVDQIERISAARRSGQRED